MSIWIGLLVIALLWPSRFIGPLDGMPLDTPSDALVIGLALPALLWLEPRYLKTRVAQGLILALLACKAVSTMAATQQGLCLQSSMPPYNIDVNSIFIDEPAGALRSWDVRADWQATAPQCTAIMTRPFRETREFPAWFLNVVDAPRTGRNIAMRLQGYVQVDEPAVLSLASIGPAERVIDGVRIDEGSITLDPGTHSLQMSMTLTGNAWKLEPRLDEDSLWKSAPTFTREPTTLDRLLAPWAWLTAPALVVALAAGWGREIARVWQPSYRLIAASVLFSAIAGVLALQTPSSFVQRTAGLVGMLGLFVDVPKRLRNLRGAFLVAGLPWLTFFATYTFGEIGRFTEYSQDDWLTYQAAGYRIVMLGYWLEGGTLFFDYQPLYRWITGLLHLVFGDSSVGEFYWDAAWLLSGALLSFWMVKARAGFRWGLAAAAITQATFLLGTPWWVTGRGLSEITAAGFGFLSMFFLLRARLGRQSSLVAAAIFAVLMFYTRLNHLLFPIFLPALLLPLSVSTRFPDLWRALRRIRPAQVLAFWGIFGAGVLLFMTRTWLYNGVFALFQGTSLRHNDTGLRPWTIFDPDVWGRVVHSVAGLVFLNEPPRPDPRMLLVPAGVFIAAAALVQVRWFRRAPAAVVIACAGAGVGALFAHTHAYPGRMSIHLVPLAVALSMIAIAALATRRIRLTL